jgi:hypothetical protein
MSYLAFVLSEKSRDRLLTLIRPAHPDIIAHHITLAFNKTNEEYEAIVKDLKGQLVRVIGIVADNKADALVCCFNDQAIRKDGGTYHITFSINKAKGVKPVYSNELIKTQKVNIFHGALYITGTFEILN